MPEIAIAVFLVFALFVLAVLGIGVLAASDDYNENRKKEYLGGYWNGEEKTHRQ